MDRLKYSNATGQTTFTSTKLTIISGNRIAFLAELPIGEAFTLKNGQDFKVVGGNWSSYNKPLTARAIVYTGKNNGKDYYRIETNETAVHMGYLSSGIPAFEDYSGKYPVQIVPLQSDTTGLGLSTTSTGIGGGASAPSPNGEFSVTNTTTSAPTQTIGEKTTQIIESVKTNNTLKYALIGIALIGLVFVYKKYGKSLKKYVKQ